MQFSLDLGPPPPPVLTYFALRPHPAAAEAIVRLIRKCSSRYGLTGFPYDAARLHVSLCAVTSRGGLRKGDVGAAMRAAKGVSASPFPIEFNWALYISGQVRTSDRVALYRRPCCGDRAVERAAAATGERGYLRGSGFEPHVTLLRDRRSVPDADLEEPVGWTVRDFVLVRSFVGERRQVDLGRWPLFGSV